MMPLRSEYQQKPICHTPGVVEKDGVMELSLNNVVPDLRDHIDEGLCSFDELISLGVIWQPFLPSCL